MPLPHQKPALIRKQVRSRKADRPNRPAEIIRNAEETYEGPRYICSTPGCGHAGEGLGVDAEGVEALHAGLYQKAGLLICCHPDCDCAHFTRGEMLPAFARACGIVPKVDRERAILQSAIAALDDFDDPMIVVETSQ